MELRRYLALGDSMSIDEYPGFDHADRLGQPGFVGGLGAASLLFRNKDAVWPEFAGADLDTRCRGIEFYSEAFDGATTQGVLDLQLPHIESGDGMHTLVTLTAGGNDLLRLIGQTASDGQRRLAEALANLAQILGAIRERLPSALVLAATVYDPTDGSGKLDGLELHDQELGWLEEYNTGVRQLCAQGLAVLVDAHAHFLGHGAAASREERWYWGTSMIEPGIRGASELRRLWLQALEPRLIDPTTSRTRRGGLFPR